jgi:hypothetical protein
LALWLQMNSFNSSLFVYLRYKLIIKAIFRKI